MCKLGEMYATCVACGSCDAHLYLCYWSAQAFSTDSFRVIVSTVLTYALVFGKTC